MGSLFSPINIFGAAAAMALTLNCFVLAQTPFFGNKRPPQPSQQTPPKAVSGPQKN